MSGNLGMPSADAKTLQFSLNYDVNTLGTYKSGTTTLSSDEFRRQTKSLILEIGYSFNDKISLDGFFSYVQQRREILRVGNVQETSGIGDLTMLLKYNVARQFYLGLGIKMPVGASDLKSGIIQLPLDLQPGSGAWDLIYYAHYSNTLFQNRATTSFSTTLIYRGTGSKDDYRQVQSYEVGNEFQAIFSLSDQVLLGSSIFDPSLTFRYRRASTDLVDEQDFPNSGGEWIFFNPGISFRATPKSSIQVNFEIPLYSNVDGTQLTPTTRFNAGIFYAFNLKEENITDFVIP